MAGIPTPPGSPSGPSKNSGVTRRSLLKGVGITALASESLLGRLADAQQTPAPSDAAELDKPISGSVTITLDINGAARQVTVEPRTTLLSALRDRLEPALTGPKLVCNAGTCGACTVILDGKNVFGCSVLAIDAINKKVTTVEGIGTPDNLSPVQAAMRDCDGMMCGFCTSGFVTSMTAFLNKNQNPTLDQVKQGLKGNFCRCGTYPRVFEATLQAAKTMKKV